MTAPKPTIARIDHALSVVAEYILRSGYDSVWPIIDRLEAEKAKLLNRDTKLEHYVSLNRDNSPEKIKKLLKHHRR